MFYTYIAYVKDEKTKGEDMTKKHPGRPASGIKRIRVGVLLPYDVVERMDERAVQARRSRSDWVRGLIIAALESRSA
jgi:hypothetical protein